MKKSILILLFAIFTTHNIAAQKVNFIGKWVAIKTEFYTEDHLTRTEKIKQNKKCIEYLEFLPGGKTRTKEYHLNCDEKDATLGTYEFKNGLWKLSGNGKSFMAKLRINNDKLQMILKMPDEEGKRKEVIVYFVKYKDSNISVDAPEKIKNYILHYKAKTMYMTATMIQYSKNYGEYRSVETNYEMFDVTKNENKKIKNRTIITPDNIYELDLIGKTGIKKPNANETEEDIDYNNLSEEFKKENNIIELPNDYIIGKKCKVFEITNEETKSHLWVWNNIVLKSTVVIRGVVFASTVTTKIDINPNFPAGIFQVPSDIAISESKQ